jgi:hypothetical protein
MSGIGTAGQGFIFWRKELGMNDDSQIISCADMISQAFSGIEKADVEKNGKMISIWEKVVSGVHGCGKNLVAHSKLIDLKNGILLVETDHPGWIQMFQINRKYILTGLKRSCPELNIETLAFRLKGNEQSLSDVYTDDNIRKERRRLEASTVHEEKILSEHGLSENRGKKEKELPDELKDVLSRLKNTMLTNSDK